MRGVKRLRQHKRFVPAGSLAVLAVAATILIATIAAIVHAAITPVTIVDPASDDIIVNGSIWLNVTFNGPANITLEYNTSGGAWQSLASASFQNGSYNYSWDTKDYPDGEYDVRVNVTNATDAPESAVVYRYGITFDNGPIAYNITALPHASRGGRNYTNSTPRFYVNITNLPPNMDSCEFSQNGTNDGWHGAVPSGNYCVYTAFLAAPLVNGTFLNATFRANDTVGNWGGNATRARYYVDNITPIAENITVSPLVQYAGTNFTNATPTYYANVTDADSGVGSCVISFNETGLADQSGSSGPNVFLAPSNTTCYYANNNPDFHIDGLVLNVTFRAVDAVGNPGANALRERFVIDAAGPLMASNTPNGTIVTHGTIFAIDVNASDLGVNITNGTACTVAIADDFSVFRESYNFTVTDSIEYHNATGSCLGAITFNNPLNLTSGNRDLRVSLRDRLNNEGGVTTFITIDTAAPRINDVAFTPNRHPANGSVNMTIIVNASDDGSNVSAVMISNGTHNMTLTGPFLGDAANGRYNISLNLSFVGCQDEAVCPLTVFVVDGAGNVNGTINFSTLPYLLFIDSVPPQNLSSSVNTTDVRINETVLFSARWSDVALLDNGDTRITPILQVYDDSSGQFVNATTCALPSSTCDWPDYLGDNLGNELGNYTNFSYIIPSSYEGRPLIARIRLNDTNGNENWTGNITAYVRNESFVVSVVSPTNNTVIAEDDFITLRFDEVGVGLNRSTILVNMTNLDGGQNYTLVYAINASYFDCSRSYNASNFTEVTLCNVTGTWPLGNFSLAVSASDNVSVAGETYHGIFITDELPDIVNISINGAIVANNTPGASFTAAITAASTDVEFNWTVRTNFTVTGTAIQFLNTTPNGLRTTVVPGNTTYALLAGKHYLRINASLDTSSLSDTVDINLTANVPLDISAIADAYTVGHGMITGWNVTVNGTDITDDIAYVNETLDIIITAENDTTSEPVTVVFNYSSHDGLALRWNGTPDSFSVIGGNDSDYGNASLSTNSNVTAIVKQRGQPTIFFDGVSPSVAVRINLSSDDHAFYYSHRNSSESSYYPHLYLLASCANSSPVITTAAASCAVEDGSLTVLHLYRFDQLDQIIIGTFPTVDINVTATPDATVRQSVIPLNITVLTPFPNATFCTYNLTLFNASNASLPFVAKTLNSSVFARAGAAWQYLENVTGANDSRYNLTVNCSSADGLNDSVQRNFSVTDTTKPSVSGVTISNIGRYTATISGRADEFVNFTVRYGTNASSLSLTQPQDDEDLLMEVSIDLDDLNTGTRYWFNLSACDAKGQCNTTANGTFVTLDPLSGSSTGGGGGGGAPDPNAPGAIETKDARVWGVLKAGETLAYPLGGNMTVRKISMRFINETSTVKLGVTQFKNKPSSVSAVGAVVYRYLSIESTNVFGRTDPPSIDVSLPKSWMNERALSTTDIVIYRLENDTWVAYPLAWVGETTTEHRFTGVIPGFSFFAVGGRQGAGSSGVPNATQAIDTPVDHVVNSPVTSLTNTTASNPAVDTADDPSVITSNRSNRSTPWLWIIGIVLVVIIGVVVGMQLYRRYQEHEALHQARVQTERQEIERRKGIAVEGAAVGLALSKPIERRPEHDPMAELHGYISRMRAKNKSDREIRDKLIAAGWDETIVDLELLRN